MTILLRNNIMMFLHKAMLLSNTIIYIYTYIHILHISVVAHLIFVAQWDATQPTNIPLTCAMLGPFFTMAPHRTPCCPRGPRQRRFQVGLFPIGCKQRSNWAMQQAATNVEDASYH